MVCVPPIERVRRWTQFALLRQSIGLYAVALHQLPKYSVQKLTGPTQAGRRPDPGRPSPELHPCRLRPYPTCRILRASEGRLIR
jgi:hypothetical protein